MTDQQSDPDFEKWKYEQNRQVAERAHDAERDFISKNQDAAVGTANLTLRTLILINGGAAVAVLAFVGHLIAANKGLDAKLAELTMTIMWFVGGVALAALAFALAYLTNYSIGESAARKTFHYDHPHVRPTDRSKRWFRFAIGFQVVAIVACRVHLRNGRSETGHQPVSRRAKIRTFTH